MIARTLIPVAGLAALAGVYFLAGKLGLALASAHPSASVVWPSTGIAIAAALVFGYRVWPAILLGAFLVNLSTAGSVATSLGIAVGNTAEGLLAAYLLNRLAGGRQCFDGPQRVLTYALLAGAIAPAVSATIGVTSLTLGGYALWHEFGSIWLTWWLGDAAGALLVGPVLILWSDPGARHLPRRRVEVGLLLTMLFLVGLAVFVGFHPLPAKTYPIAFLTLPALVWTALRFGPRATATATLIISTIAVWGTLQGTGPFARELPHESLLLLAAFMGVAALTTLVLASVVVERRQAEATLRATAEQLRLIEQRQRAEEALAAAQAIAHVGSWEWDIDANEITWSDELYRIYGLSPQEFAATYESFLRYVHPDDRDRVDSVVKSAYADHQPFEFFERIVRPDGAIRVLHSRGEVVTNGSGEAVRMLGTCHDVSEIKRAEEDRALLIREHEAHAHTEAALKQRDEFLSVAAHELKTPITSLRLFAQLLVRQAVEAPSPDQEILHKAEVIDRQSEKLSAIITQLLDITRIQAGKLPVVRQPTDVALLVAQVAASARLHSDGRTISVTPSSPVRAVLDPIRIEQVVTNLLDNALKYSPPEGSVDVEVRTPSSEVVEIMVRDRGTGVPPEHRPHIFERFYQAHVEPHDPGLGLGLYISRQIVELHGGELVAEFPDEGGSRFIVRLPTAIAESLAAVEVER